MALVTVFTHEMAVFSAAHESLYLRQPTKSYFWAHTQNIDRKYKKWTKLAWKSENLAKIFLDRESLYLIFFNGPIRKS